MKIILIVAKTLDNIIGEKGNKSLLWKQKGDMSLFKDLTTNNIVIMGNDTFKSMKSKPLKNRFNVVLTRDKKIVDECYKDYIAYAKNPYEGFAEKYFDQSLFYANDLQELLKNFKKVYNHKNIFIIGGESIYNLARNLSSDVAVDELYVTTLDVKLGDNVKNAAKFEFAPDVWEYVKTLGSGEPNEDNTYSWKTDVFTRVLNVIEI